MTLYIVAKKDQSSHDIELDFDCEQTLGVEGRPRKRSPMSCRSPRSPAKPADCQIERELETSRGLDLPKHGERVSEQAEYPEIPRKIFEKLLRELADT